MLTTVPIHFAPLTGLERLGRVGEPATVNRLQGEVRPAEVPGRKKKRSFSNEDSLSRFWTLAQCSHSNNINHRKIRDPPSSAESPHLPMQEMQSPISEQPKRSSSDISL